MRKKKTILLIFLTIIFALVSGGCGSGTNESGPNIINAKEAVGLLGSGNYVLIDTQDAEAYGNEHIKDAVNITRNDIVINIPVENMLAPKAKVQSVMGKRGITKDSELLIYDNNNNMDAARLWFTLLVYGHDPQKMKVVSGGLKALKEYGEITSEVPATTAATYTIEGKNEDMIATLDEVKAQVDDPQENVILLDVRTQEEYDEGTIPGAVLYDYINNNFSDGTYRPSDHIKIDYIENGLTPDKTIIMYCKTSIRAAQTYLALYNAGYRNLKIYDGAWLEWSANSSLPVQRPEENVIQPSVKDMS
ncbi:MAG: rhodanese-like domain-containing protein [Dehalobacterium sp.]